jgi:hypothetical protein
MDELDVWQISNEVSDVVALVTSYGASLLSLKVGGKEMTLNW